MSGNYRNFLKLLENWPLDISKAGRDLSQHIRDQIQIAFSKGDVPQVNQDQCNRYYASLKRLSLNEYGNRYKRKFESTASGLTHDQCNIALTPELLSEFQEEDLSFLQKIKRRVSGS
ncbi:ubiquinol-cytochrome-c reductase complex assembly factor 2 [Leptopilina boulardi]|uniref:ubiquinol-cytochrome-c reductase complex assembly factor 2 n=1 Tax=Leptopilina boulardi TaxID=63433 RepID=UPI0021F69256|nr:ubiquinol-cytochrome-c reductase complex assembly factor 2 [Leptopilina boulardi]